GAQTKYRLCSCLHHYSLIKEPRTWFDAKKYCRTMYSDLAMVQSKDHMERLIAAAGSDYKGDLWLGLKDYPYRWHWSFRRPNWYSGNEYYFRNWATPQPPHMRRVPLLCTAFKDGLWEVISCTTQLSFVCYYIDSFVRYVFVSTPKTWTEAELYCMKHYNNLVSVRSSHENTAVRNAVPVGVKAFIGLSRKPWSSWSSGSVTSFTYWALPPQVPNDDICVILFVSVRPLITCPSAGLCVLIPCHPLQYHFINTPLSWLNAQKYCRSQFRDLATVFDVEDMNLLVNTAQDSSGGFTARAWIGLYDNLTNNLFGDQMCVRMWSRGKWEDSNCFLRNSFICYDGLSVKLQTSLLTDIEVFSCSNVLLSFLTDTARDDKRFTFVAQEMSWPDAQQYCRRHYTDLASIRNQDENNQIQYLANNMGVWIGLYRSEDIIRQIEFIFCSRLC
uniref:Macrophage mannose receptor 1-like n=1 Tax=Cynoglossus semilaevis TaxID=244447 RepID=A0A3P8WLB9_CYNSE